MAVLQMQRINICALKKDRKQILEILQRRGVVEPCDLKTDDALFEQVGNPGHLCASQDLYALLFGGA